MKNNGECLFPFNINDIIQVTLTEEGEHILKVEDRISFDYYYDPVTKILVDQFWVVMKVFGRYFRQGSIQVFKDNTINIVMGRLSSCLYQ